MRFVLLLFLSLFVVGSSSGQIMPAYQEASFKAGTWVFQEYNSSIIKVTFRPDGYERNENLSDAVMMKPAFSSTVKRITVPTDAEKVKLHDAVINISGSSVSILKDNNSIEFSYQESDGYRGYDFRLRNNEKIFGGGERALPLNRRGYRFYLYNAPAYGYGEGAENLNYSVPFITSSRKYALFFDNASKGYFDIGKANSSVLKYGAFAGELTFYLITGNDYPQILSSYHQLTGTQPIPPLWALGTFMSRFGYTSEKQTRDIYDRMKAENVPFDAVIFDLFWFGDSIKGTIGNLDWVNRTEWPDPQKMIADFKAGGVQTILITEPFILEGTRSYESFKPYLGVDSIGKLYTLDKFYFGKGGLIDLFQKDAQLHFWEYYKKQMDIGVEGWWGDLGEPENHPADVYHKLNDFGYSRLFSADEVHNIYGHYWTKMLYDQFALNYPNKRLFSLNRSGFAGTQRYCIFPWSGDVSRSW
ncbi:MAG: TIM-barrel domain-containing protein, partial [Chitinophagales bacterium]